MAAEPPSVLSGAAGASEATAAQSASPRARLLGPPPYVGPRPFDEQDLALGRKLFGRERELSELVDMVISERIVLFYSPSGAGKTSLIQAALVPELAREGFRVLPNARVGLPLEQHDTRNRYLLSLLHTLGAPEERLGADLPSLDDYLSWLEKEQDSAGSLLLIIDQFEEVLLSDPTDFDAKAQFLAQLGAALRNRRRWALLAMREDFIAGLDPYLHLLPTGLDRRFRMDLLNEAAATKAIVGPAADVKIDLLPYAPRLVADLTRVRYAEVNGRSGYRKGAYAEPMHLQLVCLDLWRRMQAGEELTNIDLGQSVDQALAAYYREKVGEIGKASAPGVSERTIREWFEYRLITEQGVRTQLVYEGEATGGLPNAVVHALENAHLVRGESNRRGMTWIELSHDRMVDPIRDDNAQWFARTLAPVQWRALSWARENHPDRLLLAENEVAQAEAWSTQSAHDLTDTEREYLRLSRKQADRLRRDRNRSRLFVGFVGLASLAVLVLAVVLYGQAQMIREQGDKAAHVQNAFRHAVWADSRMQDDPELSILLATKVWTDDQLELDTSYAPVGDVLRRALAISRSRSTRTAGTQIVSGTFSPDAQYVVTGGADGVVRLLPTGDSDAPLSFDVRADTGNLATTAVLSPDGKWLAGAHPGGTTVYLWDVASRTPLELIDVGGPLTALAFSPDSQLLAVAGQDGRVTMWQIPSGTTWGPVLTNTDDVAQNGQPRALASIAFAPKTNDDRLITASNGGRAVIWNYKVGAILATLTPQSGGPMRDAEFSPDGTKVITASQMDGSSARVWDVTSGPKPTGQLIATLSGHSQPIESVRFSPDGWLILTASDDESARLWDAHTYQLIAPLNVNHGKVVEAEFDRDGKQVLTASTDGFIKLWTATMSSVFGRASSMGTVYQVAFNPAGTQLVAARPYGAEIWALDPQPAQVLPSLRTNSGQVQAAGFSPDGKWIVTAAQDGRLLLWDAATHSDTELGTVSGAVPSVAFSPDSALLATGGNDPHIWDLSTRRQLPMSLPSRRGPLTHLAFSPNGEYIAAGGNTDTAFILDVRTGQPVREPLKLPVPGSFFASVVFDADSQRVLTASDNGFLHVWSVTGGTPENALDSHTTMLRAAYSPADRRWIATVGNDQIIRVWDLASGTQLLSEQGRVGRAYGITFSPDGLRIAVAGADGIQVMPCQVCAGVPTLLQLADQVLARTKRALTPEEQLIYSLGS
jgi:WD40 repeat protein